MSKHRATAGSFFRSQSLQVILAGLGLMIGVIGFFIPAKEGPVVAYTAGAAGGIGLVFCVFWAVVAYSRLVKFVEVFDGGVEWEDGSGRHSAGWEEISDVWRTEVTVNGQMSVKQVVIKAGRREAVFTFILSDWKRMADAIQENSAMVIGPEAMEGYAAGEKVKFGRGLAVSQGGLTVEGKVLSWDDVDSVTVRNGYLVVRAGRRGEHHVSLGETPNFVVLMKLLERSPVPPG